MEARTSWIRGAMLGGWEEQVRSPLIAYRVGGAPSWFCVDSGVRRDSLAC